MVWLLAWSLVVQGFGFWCPMHPDQRSATAIACPICQMPMVPIPPLRVGEYRMDVTLVPAPRNQGVAAIRVAVRDPHSNAVVTAFDTVHERPFHLFILSRDFARFLHVHPEMRPDGTFELAQPLPPGEYVLIADFLPTGGVPQTLHRVVMTRGFTPPPAEARLTPPVADVREVVVDGIRATLDVTSELAGGRDAHLRFVFADAASGAPVTDLEPYLGAPAHLLMVSEDTTEAVHGHPEAATAVMPASGPSVAFDVLMPRSGPYRLWIQIQRRGTVLTFPFTLTVREP